MKKNAENPLVYQKSLDVDEISRIMKAFGIPIAVLMIALLDIYVWGDVGKVLLLTAISLVYATGVLSAILMPATRKEVLDRTLWFITLYSLGTFALKFVISKVSGVSGEMISSSLSLAVPTAFSNNISSYLVGMFLASSVLSPMGYIVMQFKAFMDFRKTVSRQKEYGRALGFRDTGNDRDRILH